MVHKMAERYTLSLNTGYLGSDSDGTTAAVTSREDDYYYIRPALGMRVATRASAALFYQYRQNDSNSAGGDFDNNQFGATLSYTF